MKRSAINRAIENFLSENPTYKIYLDSITRHVVCSGKFYTESNSFELYTERVKILAWLNQVKKTNERMEKLKERHEINQTKLSLF